jgi:hypothetical protein
MDKKTFYRVSHQDTHQGLWYNFDGKFTGLIHDAFSFCKNTELKMDFDQSIVGYLSATPELDALYHWFTKEDILKLQEHGFYIHKYESSDYWFYEKFQHFVIHRDSMYFVEKIVLN